MPQSKIHLLKRQDFHNLPIEDKLGFFKHNDRLFDILYAQQFNIEFMEQIFKSADRIRKIAKTYEGMSFLQTLLSDKRAMLFFVQPSTRTFLSFLNACHILGIKTSEIRDTSTSSEIKGESEEDMIRTFSAYVDIIITRHTDEGFAEKAAWVLNNSHGGAVPVINGGSGKDQHPTQALLDVYTIYRHFNKIDKHGINNKKFVMVGDLKRGRTVRSLVRLLALYQNIEFSFISPPEFAMKNDILEFLDNKAIKYNISINLQDHLDADVIYATRIQDEHDANKESENINIEAFNITAKTLKYMKDSAIIMHPFPRRHEISPDIDSDPRAHYLLQSRNGMWIRCALILYIFNRTEKVYQFKAST